MKHQAIKATVTQPDPPQLTHEEVDLTITALEIYATALRDELDEQAEAAQSVDEYQAPEPKAGFDYEKKLATVQVLLQKYREILRSLLTS